MTASPLTDLNALGQALENQAKNTGKLVLNESILLPALITDLRSLFLLKSDEFLTLNGISEKDIPNPSGSTLIIKAGSVLIFNQTLTPICVFTFDGKGSIELLIVFPMAADWSWEKSFPKLSIFPFSAIHASQVHFIYSSILLSQADLNQYFSSTPSEPAALAQYFPWNNDLRENVSITQGLNCMAMATPDIGGGVVDLLKTELSIPTDLKMYGPFSPSLDNTYPVMQLNMPLTGEFSISDSFKIGNFSLALSVQQPVGLIQDIGLNFLADFGDLQFSIGVEAFDSSIQFEAGPKPGKEITADIILQLPGGSNFQQYIPTELEQIFKTVALKNFSLTLTDAKKITFVYLLIGSAEDSRLSLIPNILTLKEFDLEISAFNPLDSATRSEMITVKAKAQILPTIFKDDFAFSIQLASSNSKWAIETMEGHYYGSMTLADFVHGVEPNAQIPNALNDIFFSHFILVVTKEGSGYTFSLHGECEVAFPILDTECVSTLVVTASHSSTGYDIDLNGSILIGSQDFSINLSLHKAAGGSLDSTLTASWNALDVQPVSEGTDPSDSLDDYPEGSPYLGFDEIAEALDLPSPGIPADLDLNLKSANFKYDLTANTIHFDIESVNYGTATFDTFTLKQKDPNEKTSTHAFLIELNLDKDFDIGSKLPLVGKYFSGDQALVLDQFQLIYASDDSSNVNSPPTDPFKKGATFAGNASLGGNSNSFALSLAPSSSSTPSSKSSDTPDPSSSSKPTMWISLQKSIGPLYLDKIGFSYYSSHIELLFNASLSMAGISLTLDGLGLIYDIQSKMPSAELQGLSLSFNKDPITMKGGFLHQKDANNNDIYLGELLLQVEDIGLSLLGVYQEINGQTSLFIEGILDAPLGGPPVFFVEGVAAALGYNRNLILPPIEDVATFPLVEAAMGSGASSITSAQDLTTAFSQIEKYIPPLLGNYWGGGGVKFKSFELIDSFVLIAIVFGDRFELDILGLSTLLVPPETSSTPLAEAQLALEVSFKPDEGVFSLLAQLTNNSYILSRSCHLTGGFAFFVWFSGEHSGDFVLTLGGYHPHYNVPSHYPQVPRLGFNWDVGDGLVLKGGLYFALTALAFMAGGYLDAGYSSGSVGASFKAGADFLIAWKPYHYEGDIYVDLSAHVSFISIDVGADLNIWGPEFGGKAHVHLFIISFTVSFGASATPPPPLTWTEFSSSFLPSSQPYSINVSSGTIRIVDGNPQKRWIINPKEFSIVLKSHIPCTKPLQVNSNSMTGTASSDDVNQKLGIAPMDVASGAFQSFFTMSFQRDGENVDADFSFTPITQNVPAALWGTSFKPQVSGDNFVQSAVIGYTITPKTPPQPTETLPIDLANLLYSITPYKDPYQWSALEELHLTSDDNATRLQEIVSTINSVANQRSQILKGFFSNQEIPSINLIPGVEGQFLIPPQILQGATI